MQQFFPIQCSWHIRKQKAAHRAAPEKRAEKPHIARPTVITENRGIRPRTYPTIGISVYELIYYAHHRHRIEKSKCFLASKANLTFTVGAHTKTAPCILPETGKCGAVIRLLFIFFSTDRSTEPIQVLPAQCVSFRRFLRGELTRFGECPEFIDPFRFLLVKSTFHF